MSMITEHDEKVVTQIIKHIDEQVLLAEGGVDWDTHDWIDTLDRIVNSLRIAPLSYRYCSKEDIEDRFFTAECSVCGWWGSSKFLGGGGAIADTGDHDDCTCPVCGTIEHYDKGDDPALDEIENTLKKTIAYKDKQYKIEIKKGGSGESYFFRVIGIGGFNLLPNTCLTDMEKFKNLIIYVINNELYYTDLKVIEMWDGKI